MLPFGKEEAKKGEVSDYPSALKTGVFVPTSNPRLVPRGRYELSRGLFRGILLLQVQRIGVVPLNG